MDNPSLRHDQALWRAVVLQALTDATSTATNDAAVRDRKAARNWLTWPCHQRDFERVCALADLESDKVRAVARKLISDASSDQTQSNRRGGTQAKTISFNNEELTVADWAARLGLSRAAIFARIKKGWSLERTLSAPHQRPGHRGGSRQLRQNHPGPASSRRARVGLIRVFRNGSFTR